MLPWRDLMRAAACLGITPAQFWQLSLREWIWITRGETGALSRQDLDSLMIKNPDTEQINGAG